VGEGRWTGEERRRENRGGQEKRATADAPRPRRPQKETVGGVNRVGRRPGWLAAWWGRGVTSRAKEEISQGRRARRGRHRTGRTRTRTHGTTVHLGDRIRGNGRPCARVDCGEYEGMDGRVPECASAGGWLLEIVWPRWTGGPKRKISQASEFRFCA
jgi:hypothetical protein